MKSISFPNMFNNKVSTATVSDYDATLQNLKLILKANKSEMFGDPYFGSGFEKYMFNQNDFILQDLVIDDIYMAIKEFMPQLKVTRRDISVTTGALGEAIVKIKAINAIDFTTDLYTIVMTDE